MAKRFTDTHKWRNPWFRDLSDKAKLVWVYLCDECDHSGIWKADFALASFQLNFKVTHQQLLLWFDNKIHFFGEDKILVVQFFEFQYGQSKDTWSAKVEAKKRLENLGFSVANNKVSATQSTTVAPLWGESDPTSLSRVIVKGKVNNYNKSSKFDFLEIYKLYPRKIGKKDGLEICETEILTQEDYSLLCKAVKKYAAFCASENKDDKFIMYFSTFMGLWRDWSDDDAGSTNLPNNKQKGIAEILAEDAAKQARIGHT